LILELSNKLSKERKKDLTVLLGQKDWCILPFHNQWLYGRSALQNALNVLQHTSQFTTKEKTDPKSYTGYNTPFAYNGIRVNFQVFERYISAIEFIMNYIPVRTQYADAGLGSGFFEASPEMTHDFTLGDNNDGITIIDAIESKYCFMNINENSSMDELRYSASDLPYLTPCTAHDYVSKYYGETLETCNPYYIEKAKIPVDELLQKHKTDNAKLHKKFNKFKLLTYTDILNMFPHMAVKLHSVI
jgi:hypothetical protein